MLVIMAQSLTVACGGDGDEKNGSSDYSDYDNQMTSELSGTSWKFIKSSEASNVSGVLTFGSDGTLYCINMKKNHSDVISGSLGIWSFKDGLLVTLPGGTENTGGLIAIVGVNHKVTTLNSSELVLVDYDDGEERTFSRTSYTEAGGNTGGGGSTGGDVPYVTSFDYTATKSSITVKFMCSERPTSATVKYGTSSATKSISSSISSKQVSATATGLKAGTKYYFKCTVKNSNGSSTSDEFPVMTNY